VLRPRVLAAGGCAPPAVRFGRNVERFGFFRRCSLIQFYNYPCTRPSVGRPTAAETSEPQMIRQLRVPQMTSNPGRSESVGVCPNQPSHAEYLPRFSYTGFKIDQIRRFAAPVVLSQEAPPAHPGAGRGCCRRRILSDGCVGFAVAGGWRANASSLTPVRLHSLIGRPSLIREPADSTRRDQNEDACSATTSAPRLVQKNSSAARACHPKQGKV